VIAAASGAVAVDTRRVETAVVEAVAYADVFDWPLSCDEVHRFLPVAADVDEVSRALCTAEVLRVVRRVDELYVLRGREALVASRVAREEASRRIWAEVARRTRLLARIPWIRMVAVSGSLAVSAARDGDDIDLFVVTDDGRLWLSRALTIAAGRVPLPRRLSPRSTLCPNYLLSASALTLRERDVYTAHELVQLVPLFGEETYRELLARNAWYREFLPNHPGYTGVVAARRGAVAPLLLRGLLGGPVGARVERWEMARKVARLRDAAGPGVETRFDDDICKGHVDGHRARFWAAYRARLEALAR